MACLIWSAHIESYGQLRARAYLRRRWRSFVASWESVERRRFLHNPHTAVYLLRLWFFALLLPYSHHNPAAAVPNSQFLCVCANATLIFRASEPCRLILLQSLFGSTAAIAAQCGCLHEGRLCRSHLRLAKETSVGSTCPYCWYQDCRAAWVAAKGDTCAAALSFFIAAFSSGVFDDDVPISLCLA